MAKAEKYLLGLDLGTDSVGWCLTDENYNVIRKNGKSLWGSRLFEEAKPAAERRLARGQRRRLQRRRERIDLLQELFAPEMNKVDSQFFQRMDLSKYHKEDREEYFSSKSVLFNDSNFDDSAFYATYPTIYHLRHELMVSDKKEDLRLIYLAIHHMIKYRGNFLFEGREFKPMDKDDLTKDIQKLNEYLSFLDRPVFCFEDDKFDERLTKLNEAVGQMRTVTSLKESLSSIFEVSDSYISKVVVPMISGGTVQLKALFELDENPEINIKKISCKRREL